MIRGTCLERVRNPKNKRIEKYLLLDLSSKKRFKMKSDELAYLMAMGQIDIDNLKLTTDGRIILKKSGEQAFKGDAHAPLTAVRIVAKRIAEAAGLMEHYMKIDTAKQIFML